MHTKNDFETIFSGHPSVEAVIRLSRDGLPLASRARGNAPVDEIVSIVAGLFAAAAEAGLVENKDQGRLYIGARHGSLYCRAVGPEALLLMLTVDQCTEEQFERIFEAWRATNEP